jgi:hypothetical protein
MKNIVAILFLIGFSFNAKAQIKTMEDSTCSCFKNLTFKNGVDTVEFKATYDAFLEGSDEVFLKILADKKKLQYSEYMIHYNSNSISFMPIGCRQLYQVHSVEKFMMRHLSERRMTLENTREKSLILIM